MADIDRPLMSLDASGAFGGTIIFFRLRGARHARSYSRTPAHNTPKATAAKSKAGLWSHAWPRLPVQPVTRAGWDRYALILTKPMSGFNAYLGKGLDSNFTPGEEVTTVISFEFPVDQATFVFHNVNTFGPNIVPLTIDVLHGRTPIDLKLLETQTGILSSIQIDIGAIGLGTHYIQLRSTQATLSGIEKFVI